MDGDQGRDLERGTEAEVMEECTCSLWLAQLTFLYSTGPPDKDEIASMGWALRLQSIKKCSHTYLLPV